MSHGTTRKNHSKATSSSGNALTESRISRIARRAHEIYEARGGAHGKALEDWLRAEREIDAEMENEGRTR